jgi:glutamate-1-semialdehyde 2,1-aminomutase
MTQPVTRSAEELYEFAQHYLPGGVCASARNNPAIGRPFFVSHGEGPYVFDLDGKKYIDLCISHGASLLGHNHPKITEAIRCALEAGIICSYETVHHAVLAQKISEVVPCAQMSRFAGSGTETIMHGLRLARAATGREKIIKFEGHFHGYSDDIFISSAPPIDQAGLPSSPQPYLQSAGTPTQARELVIIVPFNDPPALEKAFAEHGHEAAALILEPINYDSGCILPQSGFIQLCRQLCDRYNVILFFDEVLTAFRVALGGAQELYGVTPDMCVLGKAIGAGMPISALAGKQEIMQNLRPQGQSEMSGTYLAHLTAVLSAQAAIDVYDQPNFYSQLEKLCKRFYSGFQTIIDHSGVPLRLQYVGPRFGLYFGIEEPVTNYRQAAKQNNAMSLKFISACIQRKVYIHVSPHHGFSAVHTESDLDNALEAIEGALADVRKEFS